MSLDGHEAKIIFMEQSYKEAIKIVDGCCSYRKDALMLADEMIFEGGVKNDFFTSFPFDCLKIYDVSFVVSVMNVLTLSTDLLCHK